MFGIGLPEMIVIAIVALVFIGPKNLPGVLRSVGRGLVQLKRATNEVRTTVQDEMDQIERDIDLKDVREAATDLKKDFDGVKSGLDPLSMNRISSGEKLEAVADVMDEQEKKKINDQANIEAEKLIKDMSEKFSKSAEIKKNLANIKISQMKDAAIKDIKDTSIKIAIEAVKKTISTSVDKSKLDILFAKNLEETKIELKKVNS